MLSIRVLEYATADADRHTGTSKFPPWPRFGTIAWYGTLYLGTEGAANSRSWRGRQPVLLMRGCQSLSTHMFIASCEPFGLSALSGFWQAAPIDGQKFPSSMTV